jgi:hypothetical protein
VFEDIIAVYYFNTAINTTGLPYPGAKNDLVASRKSLYSISLVKNKKKGSVKMVRGFLGVLKIQGLRGATKVRPGLL